MIRLVLMVGLLLLLVGCESYALRGKVVPGEHSEVLVVDRNDPRLEQRGLGEMTVSAMLDPTRVNRQPLGKVQTDHNGAFALPVDEFGAGLLEYDVLVAAHGPERQAAERIMPLPGGSKRLLIRLGRGQGRYQPSYSDPLDEAMRDAQPYMAD